MNQTLLPAGCYDVLPPYARLEAKLNHQLLSCFESYGYQQVNPPLMEYTDSLLAGRGGVLSPHVIRVMDPETHKVIGFRPDMTLQVGRIATSRMHEASRPLRLCYSGPVLRIQGDATTKKRQRQQTGIELIGADNAQADAEIIIIAVHALQTAGVGHLTVDLNLPVLIGMLLAESSLDNDELGMVFESLAHKDATRLKQFQEQACDLLCELMLISGEASKALDLLKSKTLPEGLAEHLKRLEGIINIIRAQTGENVTVTLDVTERGGMDYYSGISFAIFSTEKSVELGRGGRYLIDHSRDRESAIGCTFYSDSIDRILPIPAPLPRVYVAAGIEEKKLAKLQDQGYVTILALEDAGNADIRNVARRHHCQFVYESGELIKL